MVRCQVLVIGGDIGQSASRAFKWNILFYWRELQGAVAQRPISTQPGILFLSIKKHFFGQFSLLFLRASNHQLVDKVSYIEFTV